ncbi:MAG: hypothetical protein ACXWK6_06665 [Myxococcaceae bacterium]
MTAPACKWGEPPSIAFEPAQGTAAERCAFFPRFKNQREKNMPDQQNEQNKPMQGPGENQPMTQPDEGNEGIDKDRKASDQDYMKKHSPSPNNPNNPNR